MPLSMYLVTVKRELWTLLGSSNFQKDNFKKITITMTEVVLIQVLTLEAVLCRCSYEKVFCRKPMPKCDLNKVALQLYWNPTWAWVFSSKFATYFQNTFSWEHFRRAASVTRNTMAPSYHLKVSSGQNKEIPFFSCFSHLVLNLHVRVTKFFQLVDVQGQ